MKEPSIKTTVELPKSLWQAAKIRAVNDETDFKRVVIAALEGYLKRGRNNHERDSKGNDARA